MIFEVWVVWAVLAALVLDALIGDPDWLWQRIPHPVVLIGRAISMLDRALNRGGATPGMNRAAGALALALVVGGAAGIGWVVHDLLTGTLPVWAAFGVEVVAIAVLLAQRSLYEHVARVRTAFDAGGLDGARVAVSQIVGRDPKSLDAPAVTRASIETTAENFSDGVVAPAFWALIGGLPGVMAYKALNTADSMIGHRTDRYRDFGWAAARADDIANWLPARLSGVIVVAAAGVAGYSAVRAAQAMWQDAWKHRSPNAGWPEAAMAGALDVALAGPRRYNGAVVDDPWLNSGGDHHPAPERIADGLRIFVAACAVHGVLLAVLASILTAGG